MPDRWKVLLPKEIDPSGPDSIADFADCTGMDEYDSDDDALADIGRYDAVIVRVAALTAEVIDRADNLRVIAKHGAGLDNVDIEAAAERGIVVCNTPGANAQSVAEHAIASLFALRRHLHTADRHVRAGEWERAAFSGRELTNDTLGLYGFGNIAQTTAAMATGMGMRVVAYDPRRPDEAFPAAVQRAERFEGLFERSDAVSVHVPLTDQTHHSISTAELSALGEHGVVVNTARGAVIDEAALVDALETGTVGGAALDTFESEPPGEDHPLYGRDDVLLTPHIGGVTTQALARMSRQAAANVRTVYEGGRPDSACNEAALSEADGQ